MKRHFFLVMAVALFVVTAAFSQTRVREYLHPNIKYPNGKEWNDAVGDSLSDAVPDTISFSVLGSGKKAPINVTVMIECNGVGGAKDSVQVTWRVGHGSPFYVTLGSAVNEFTTVADAGTYIIRTFVINTTGAAIANNAQATVAPDFSAMQIVLKQATDDNETISYRIRAWGTYEQ